MQPKTERYVIALAVALFLVFLPTAVAPDFACVDSSTALGERRQAAPALVVLGSMIAFFVAIAARQEAARTQWTRGTSFISAIGLVVGLFGLVGALFTAAAAGALC